MKSLVLLISVLLFLGTSCKQKKKYLDTSPKEIINDKSGALQAIVEFQSTLNEEFRNPETSPLPDRFRKDF